jgi:hypothetical protein
LGVVGSRPRVAASHLHPSKRKKEKKKRGETSQNPLELLAVLKYPPILKNSQFTPLNFQLLSIWTNPYKLGYKIKKKKKNQITLDFHFFKKIKKHFGS